MAKAPPRRTGPRTGGRLALFEVLQAQPEGDAAQGPPNPVPAHAAGSQATRSPQTAPAQPAMPTYASAPAEPLRGGLTGGQIGMAVGGLLCILLACGAFFFGRMSASTAEDAAPVELVPEALAVGGPTGRQAAPATRTPAASVLKTSTAELRSRQAAVERSGPVQRVAGTNYLLVQSYARSEGDRAEATVAALRAAGIDATIETGIKGWPNRLCIFGTESFERVRKNPAYNSYLARVKAVGNSTTNRKIKRFDPMPVRWDH